MTLRDSDQGITIDLRESKIAKSKILVSLSAGYTEENGAVAVGIHGQSCDIARISCTIKRVPVTR